MNEQPAVLLGVDGPLAHLTLNRPERHNALGAATVDGFVQAIAELQQNHQLRCLVVSGAGRSFCSGADLQERKGMAEPDVRRFVVRMRDTISALADLPFPTIAAVHGLALGGGCEVALACDIRVIHSGARLGLTEVGWGIIPAAGGTQRLQRLVGIGRAKQLIFTGTQLSAAEAAAIGLAEQVVEGEDPGESVREAADGLARRIAAMGPLAVRQAKRALNYGADQPLHDGLAFEWQCYEAILPSKDRLEGLAAFAEKRPPVFRGE